MVGTGPKMGRRLIVVLFAALTLAAPVAASDTYAGLTRTQAIDKAASGLVSLGIALDGWTPAQAVKNRRELDKTPAKATHSTCKHKPAWRVLWPKTTPIYVNHRGIVMACTMHVTVTH